MSRFLKLSHKMDKRIINANFLGLLNKLKAQFLSCYPIEQMDWQSFPLKMSWAEQQQLIDLTYGHILNQNYPIKTSFQLKFLKRLLLLLEKNHNDIHDIVYESYCYALQRSKDNAKSYAYKHYVLSAYGVEITFQESESFVLNGTTGLCTWQASLALIDFLLKNCDFVTNQNIVELGAGTGLCGIILGRCLQPRNVLLTDGSPECIKLIHKNIEANFERSKIYSGVLKCDVLRWDDVKDFFWEEYKQINLLLASDVVYDEEYIPALTFAIDYLFKMRNNEVQMLLSATVRNKQTLDKFVTTMVKLNFSFEEFSVLPPDQSQLHWDRSTPVKIYFIKRFNYGQY